MARRAIRVLKIFLVIAIVVVILASYTMFKTAGDYSGEVLLAKTNNGYTVEGLLIRARPERLQGNYLVTLVFHVRATLKGAGESLPRSMAEDVARQYVEVTCPAKYEYRVGTPSMLEKVTVGASSEATFDIPVYITVKGFKVRLEPGKETRVDVKLKAGCIVIREYIGLDLMLEPVAGGFVVNVGNVTVTVKG